MIPAEIVECIIKKVQEMQEAKASDLARDLDRIRMFVGAGFTKYINEGESTRLFYVLKKATVSYGRDQDGTEVFGECHFDAYDDEQVYVTSSKYTIYNMDLYIKGIVESSILNNEEDIIVSCERLWMH